MTKSLVVKCSAKSKSTGKRCKNNAIEGATVCRMHGANKKVRAKAAIRAELTHWGLRDALVGDAHGEFGKIGEYVRGLAKLEAEERDRCATFATKAIADGLEERRVRLAERQGELIAGAIKAIPGRLDLTPKQPTIATTVVREELIALSA